MKDLDKLFYKENYLELLTHNLTKRMNILELVYFVSELYKEWDTISQSTGADEEYQEFIMHRLHREAFEENTPWRRNKTELLRKIIRGDVDKR